jgi:hypothetical protein
LLAEYDFRILVLCVLGLRAGSQASSGSSDVGLGGLRRVWRWNRLQE